MRKQNAVEKDGIAQALKESTAVATAVLEPPAVHEEAAKPPRTAPRRIRAQAAPFAGTRFAAMPLEEHGSNHQAELFYLQKQIQQQTQMVFLLEDGSRVRGVVEWYDRNSIKVRGKSRVLIYKSAIKYLYKASELGAGKDE